MFRILPHTALTPHQANILVEESGHVLIADFGLTKVTKNLNSMRWVAPEVWNEGSYSEKADIFSFAMVMIEVRHRQYTV